MTMSEKNVQSNECRLDKLSLNRTELTQDEADQQVVDYYKYIEEAIKKQEDSPRAKEYSKGYVELDVFVERATGMAYQVLLIPSNLTREVPWTVVQIGVKPEDGINKYITMNQSERRKKFGEEVVRAEAIHYMDHGYNSGIPAEKVIVDGLATGELPQMKSTDLMVMLMTKGSGHTYTEPGQDHNRGDLPAYDMDATYAQLAEAMCSIDGYLANKVKDFYLGNPVVDQAGNLLDISRHQKAKFLLDLAELKSGTWASNRGVSVRGHSMAGWEAIRAYLGEVFGRFTPGMEKYNSDLLSAYKNSTNQYLSAYLTLDSSLSSEVRLVVDQLVSPNSILNKKENDVSGEPQIVLGDITSRWAEKDGGLRSILTNRRPNMIFEAETPLMEGDEKHTLITTWRHAPELRLIMLVREKLGKKAADLGLSLGYKTPILRKGVNRLVRDTAYGKEQIRATHSVGLMIGLDAAYMDERALKGARGLGNDTIRRHEIKWVSAIESLENREQSTGRMSRLKIHAGKKDTVLNPDQMERDALSLLSAPVDQLKDLFEMHELDSHYLSKDTVVKIWCEIFSRRNAVTAHRRSTIDLIANNLN